MVKYLGHGLFDVDGDAMEYDFRRDEFSSGFTKEEMDEAFNMPSFKEDLAIVADRHRAEVRRLGPNWEFSPDNPEIYEI